MIYIIDIWKIQNIVKFEKIEDLPQILDDKKNIIWYNKKVTKGR